MAFPINNALITGAHGGLGSAIANALIQRDVSVTGTTRNPGSPTRNDNLQWLVLDASTSEGIHRFLKEHDDVLRDSDLVINNAGSGIFGEFAQFQSDDIESQIHLMLLAPMLISRVVLNHFQSRGQGILVNTASLAATFPLPYLTPYNAAKAGLSGLTQSLIQENTHPHIQIIDFCPGDFNTNFNLNMKRLSPLPSRLENVYQKLDKLMRDSPPPEMAARDLLQYLDSGKSGTLVSGGHFQRVWAPLGARLLPERILRYLSRRYFGLHRA